MNKSQLVKQSAWKLLLLVLLVPLTAHATLPFAATPEEKKLLPGFCGGSVGRGPGPALVYGNHFCYGLNFLNRGNRTFGNKKDRTYYYNQAVGEMQSTINRTEKANASGKYNRGLGVVYRYQAEALERLGRLIKAIEGYQKSIRYLPKQTRAYINLSNIYKRQGLKKDAKEVLEQGLKAMPKSKALKKRLNRLK